VGTILPDALGRVVPLGLEVLQQAGAPIPGPLIWMWAALHEPLGWSLVCLLLAQGFVAEHRRLVLGGLWLGCALHTGLDVLQFHHGEGYLLLAPLSTRRLELGWIGSEATVVVALPLLAATAVGWLPRLVEERWGVPSVRWPAVLAVTLPVHLLLPVAGSALVEPLGPEGVATAWLWLHLAFATFLVSSRRWWADRWVELGVVVGLNHLATAAGFLLL
jgi:hypothetical protein